MPETETPAPVATPATPVAEVMPPVVAAPVPTTTPDTVVPAPQKPGFLGGIKSFLHIK